MLFCTVLCIFYAILDFPCYDDQYALGDFLLLGRPNHYPPNDRGRNEEYRALGGQLDSLIDIVRFGICPAFVFRAMENSIPGFYCGRL
jgi:CDP-diacylglycerol--serine O-phosphatidyltransferase